MNIAKAIRSFLKHRADPPPNNESSTCERIIYPLLLAIGYETREILSHGLDAGGKVPDYTLLPETQHTFYLEAKAWNVGLEHQHAVQALNYANQNGRQWVVLTNGQKWQLYDNHIQGLPGQKLVAEAHIKNQKEAESFFDAISKKSVCSGGLPGFAEEQRDLRKRQEAEEKRRREDESRKAKLRALLLADLGSGDSPLVQAILTHVNQIQGFGQTTGQEIVECLAGIPTTIQPPPPSDRVVVVAARSAWPDYLKFSAYIRQTTHPIKGATHIAFYCRGAVQTYVPRILEIVQAVKLSEECVEADPALSEGTRAKLLDLIRRLRSGGFTGEFGSERKVVFLSAPKAPETVDIGGEIPNTCVTSTGRPRSFNLGQRYVSLAKLRSRPAGTKELATEKRTVGLSTKYKS